MPTSIAPLTAPGTLPKATLVPASINSASAMACADDPLDAAMAKRCMARASTAMAPRKAAPGCLAQRSRKDSQPGPPSVRNDQLK
ncbi:MAG: hypothetical protein ACK55Z_03010, partial [bacterium]